MSDELEFIDVALLKRIDAETTVENFGSKVNSSFFEAANLLGALKIKELVDIHSAIGNSPVIITDKGKALLRDLDAYSEADVTKMDSAVLGCVRGGMKSPKQIEAALNIKSRDVAFSIYRLVKKGLLDYKVRNADVELMLTTQGFEEENPIVKEHANRALAKIVQVKQEVKGPPEVRNKTAEELASEEFNIAEGGDAEPTDRNISKMLYYVDRYKWHALGAAVAIAMAFVYLLIIAK